MPEAQMPERIADAAEKGGSRKELFAALRSAVEADLDAFAEPEERDSAGLRDARADGSPPRARHGGPGLGSGSGAALVAAIGAEVDALIGPGPVDAADFEALEQAVRHRSLDIAAQWMAQRCNADDSDHSGSTTACACGRRARYAGRRPKTFTTLLGPVTLHRAYYHCDACRKGVCPRDCALGLHGTSLSPAVTRRVGWTAAEVSFAKASQLLAALAGVEVETRQVERCAEALGREVADDERSVPEQTPPAPASTVYLGLDGTGVPVRPTEVEGRRGKQPDGSAKTREVKLVTVWTAEGRDSQGRPVRDRGSVSYNAAVESAASRDTDPQPPAFAQRVYREANRRGFDTAAQRVVLGDGAAWIWNLAAEQFPDAIEIVDIYHAKQHLCDVAKALYGPGTDLGRPLGPRPAGRTRRRPAVRRRRRAARPCRDHARGANVHSVRVREPPPDALSAVPRPGPVRLVGRRRGRMQAARRPAQARRHALDRRRGQRHPRPPLLHPQRTLRGLLGATSRKGRLTLISR